MKWTAEMKAAQSEKIKAAWNKKKWEKGLGFKAMIEQPIALRPWPTDIPVHDPVNHPPHYTSHPSGVECIQVTEHLNFCVGNAIKYLWRAGEKGSYVQDLEKAKWYIEREIARMRTS